MAAPTVYEGIAEDIQLDGVGELFAGKKFWVAQRVPRRNQFLDDIRANGGEIVMLEKKADYLIADHFRRGCPPGSISYQFVEKSIRDGRIRDPEDHRAGPRLGEAREPGALNRPTKSSRAAFTAEEDNILYKWVRDFEKQGGAISGNEIYKQLEAKYPRHTFQSWRDRYLKQLRNRPPSAFNIPNNAPPSPPSDEVERAPNPRHVPSKVKPTATRPRNTDGTSNIGKTRKKPEAEQDYTLEQLAATFTSDDWEELYAFVDVIEERAGNEDEYTASWNRWAKSQDNQTAEQWRQYYEKVVRPQWRRDPEWKRNQVKEKVEKKYEERISQSQNTAEEQPDTEDAAATKDPSNHLPKEDLAQEATATTSQLGSEEESVQKEPPRQSPVLEQGNQGPAEPEAKAMSSSTAQYQSPSYISAVYQNAMKRVRDFTRSRPPEENESPRPSKRQRSISPARNNNVDGQSLPGTQEEPWEILSSPSSTKISQSEAHVSEATGNVPGDDGPQTATEIFEDFVESPVPETDDDVSESRELSDLEELPDQPSESDLPSNTPTPRAPRHGPSNFDAQAVLSSPLQDMQIPRLSRPTLPDDTQRSSSLAPHPPSEASTTHSLEEFRRSLNDLDRRLVYPTLNLQSRTPSPSSTPSVISITSDEDPDPPLDASELNEYFDLKLKEGFPDEFIIKALKRTRFRPDLTDLVLEAWGAGQPLPDQRGIWSLDEDEAVEKGDNAVLVGLERKHTLDGWGGITERRRFLEGYRSR